MSRTALLFSPFRGSILFSNGQNVPKTHGCPRSFIREKWSKFVLKNGWTGFTGLNRFSNCLGKIKNINISTFLSQFQNALQGCQACPNEIGYGMERGN
ncbi:MAG: hypothetical protein ACRD97_06365 [Nitrososphaeraceae archaeon]